MNALHLLRALNDEFPLSTMGPDFKGTHALTLFNGELVANVYWNGQAWYAKITGDALMDEPRPLCRFLKAKFSDLEAQGPPPDQTPPSATAPASPSAPPPSGDSGLKAE